MATVREARIRSSARFELKRLGDLAPEQREPFRELERDAEFCGLLVPRGSSVLNIKSVDRETADLFRRFSTPCPVQAGELDASLIDLILDGVLEVECDAGFVSGADALRLLCAIDDDVSDGHGVARLSHECLRYAADLECCDPAVLTNAIYLYNRIPLSRFWSARFPDRKAVLRHLGIDTSALGRWHAPAEVQGWISWHPRSALHAVADAATYKLYVSPRPENIRDAFHGVVGALSDAGPAPFKIGEDAAGLLRPDKLVAYFGSHDELDIAADAVLRRLAGCPAHGVPFTAAIDGDGLLSWGVDPPASERALSWQGRESWRLWLATKLGDAIALAKAHGTRQAVEPWRFARERIRRMGVDVDRWTPTASLWSTS